MINEAMRDTILGQLRAESALLHLFESSDCLDRIGIRLLEGQLELQYGPQVEIARHNSSLIKPVLHLPPVPTTVLDGLGSLANALSLFVWVTDPTIRRSVAVLRQPIADWPAGELQLATTSVRRVSWSEETFVGVAIVLNENQVLLPGAVYRSGQWLARKRFTVTYPPMREDMFAQSRIWSAHISQADRKWYFGLPRTNIESYLEALQIDNSLLMDRLIYRVEPGTHSIEPEIDEIVQRLTALRRNYPNSISQKGEDAQSFEREASIIVHSTLRNADLTMLADPDFWNWVAAAKLHRIIRWRYEQNSATAHLANYGAPNLTENFAFRLWLRGELGYSDFNSADPYELARVDGIDLWRSHLFRQSYAYARHVTRALLMLQAGKLAVRPLNTPEIRILAKELNKLRQDVILEYLSAAQAIELVQEQAVRAVTLTGKTSS